MIQNIQEEENVFQEIRNKMSKSTIYTEKQEIVLLPALKCRVGYFLIVVVVSVSKSRVPRVRYNRTATEFLLLAKQ